ncbi:MAG: hypothetical protein U9Q66_00080 [Patescibacteria group bacterium]|nr:hypothetical protein [Patescibacteria group bacterium]
MVKMFEKNISKDNRDKHFIENLKRIDNVDQQALLIQEFTNKYQIDRHNRFAEDKNLDINNK